jgi:phospho-N-acetylmuramoyl-pentapeptide-transferase
VLLFGNLGNRSVHVALWATVWLGLVGFLDDYLRVVKNLRKGLLGRYKIAGQVAVGLVVGTLVLAFPQTALPPSITTVPFFKYEYIDFGWLFVPFVVLVVTGSSNAVNLTDGLDGLAIVPTLMAAATFTLFAYVAGHAAIARYLQVIFVKGASELTMFAAALVGASLGFLWFNAHPAQVFMGDTGSLALGGALATIALVTKNELILVVAGGCFVAEALSVIIQVFWYKRTGRRVFRMAPIHHHYELNGLPEPKIIVRFWIVSFVLQVIALTTLKLR